MEKRNIEPLSSFSESITTGNDTRIFEIFRKAGVSELANEDFQFLEKQKIVVSNSIH